MEKINMKTCSYNSAKIQAVIKLKKCFFLFLKREINLLYHCLTVASTNCSASSCHFAKKKGSIKLDTNGNCSICCAPVCLIKSVRLDI